MRPAPPARLNGDALELRPSDADARAALAGAVPPRRQRFDIVRKADGAELGVVVLERAAGRPLRVEVRAFAQHAELRELPGLLQRLLRHTAPGRTCRVDAWIGDLRSAWSLSPHAVARATRRHLRRRARGAPQASLAALVRSLRLPEDYAAARRLVRQPEPPLLLPADVDVHGRVQWLVPAAVRAWRTLRDAAQRDGITLQLVSAFRDVGYQARLLRRKLERGHALERILEVNAAPGYSEHHGGRAIDVTTPGYATLEDEFERSPAYAWLERHAQRFGFGLSFPRDNPHGIAFEPWHWCHRA